MQKRHPTIKRISTGITVRILALGLALTVCVSPVLAQSIYPEDGWWWNPDESGRGYLLERQDDLIFIASFHYTDTGEPEWLTIVGDYIPETDTQNVIGTMTGEVTVATDGQCIGCEHAAPKIELSGQDSAVLTFHDNQSATLEWTDETIELTRFFWAWENMLGRLDGRWILITVPADGSPAAVIVTITADGNEGSVVDDAGNELALIQLVDDALWLAGAGLTEAQPILVPETNRFYAGSARAGSDAVMGLRIDDFPVVIPEDIAAIIDIRDVVFTETSPDCGDYANQYTAEVRDEQRSIGFTESVVIVSSGTSCTLSSNAIPNHDFNDSSASFATPVSEIERDFVLLRNPQVASAPTALAQNSYDAVMLNGVVLDLLSAGCYRPGDGRADGNGNVAIGCNVNSDWLLDPLGYENNFGVDRHNAHTQPDGTYHYHGNPIAMFADEPSNGVSPVIGFAADGFPIYGSYFLDETTLTIRKAVSGWALKQGTRDAVNGPGGAYNGWYIDDYEFAGTGDLDQCNGMMVNGQYGYYVTDSYPWVLGCLSGTPHTSFRKN